MFKPVSMFVGLRYTRTRKHNYFISFVSIISMLGISLGVIALVVVLSVINGSTSTMRDETLKSIPHVTVSGAGVSADWQRLAEKASASEQVLGAAPFVEAEVMLRHQGQTQFIRLRGIDPGLEPSVLENDSSAYRELLQALDSSKSGIVLGNQLAGRLGIFGRGEVSITPLRSLLARSLDDSRGFQVIATADFGFYGNENIALINLDEAQEIFAQNGNGGLQLRLRVNDVFDAANIANEALAGESGLRIQPWSEIQANLFNALRMEKIMTGFMLLMIVLIGAVNIVSTLVMVVAEKGADIAILRTMGASRKTVMAIFMVQGVIAGLIGTLLGMVLGVLLALNITDLSLLLERFINDTFAGSNIYLISHLQSELVWGDVALVGVAALLISFLATLYPAYRAANIQPAEVLRYE
jgi:lipoprotein-releasing system permease protein